MNKKAIITLLLTLASLAGQAQIEVSIKGTAQPEAKTVYVFGNLDFRRPDSIDVVNGQWLYRPEARPVLPGMRIFMSDVAFSRQDLSGMVALMADGVPTTADLTTGTVKGSKASEAMNKTVRGLLSLMQNGGSKDEAFRLMHEAVMDNLDSMLPLEFVPMIADGLSAGDLGRIFYPGAPYADLPQMQQAKERLALLSGQSVRSIGRPFTDLVVSDTTGTSRRLSEWCGKGRYVLIDFWASWCGPCRMEMPNVTRCYEKYHDKGLDIIGISFDNNREAWLRAIQALNMPWIHLSDLAGWKSIGAKTYEIRSIPSNILLDGNGKIIDIDLRGEQLDMRLAEIFKTNASHNE